MQILQTDLYTFLLRISYENLKKKPLKAFPLCMWIILFILTALDDVCTLSGEN